MQGFLHFLHLERSRRNAPGLRLLRGKTSREGDGGANSIIVFVGSEMISSRESILRLSGRRNPNIGRPFYDINPGLGQNEEIEVTLTFWRGPVLK